MSSGKIPFTLHLYYPQFMEDADPDQRELAMFFNRVLLAKCEALWAYVGRVSPGMRLEIGWARDLDLPIKFSILLSRRSPHDHADDFVLRHCCWRAEQ